VVSFALYNLSWPTDNDAHVPHATFLMDAGFPRGMARLEFQDLRFEEENESVKVTLYDIYFARIPKDALSRSGNFRVEAHAIEWDLPEKKAQNHFHRILQEAFQDLKCSINGKRTIYIHRNSGVPLVGEGIFGLIDRNTNCIEVKPLTACNLDCVFCSVDAGPASRRQSDYIVEMDYLLEEFNKLAGMKRNDVEAHIGPQGEPLLYAPIVDLIRGLRANPKVKVVSIDTNGTLLTKKLVDSMVEAGLTRLNISLQATTAEKASMLAGRPYNTKHVLDMIYYAAKKTNVLIAPVVVPTLNDDEIDGIVKIGKAIRSEYPALGIQNFLNYKRGRNPVKQRGWDEFYAILKKHEEKGSIRLRLSKEDFGILSDTKLEKPFKKRDVVKAIIVCDGPERGEKIGACRDRAIIIDCAEDCPLNSSVKVEIVRDKHNIYRGVAR
jgi:uncharacterized protein